jgi:endonuclease/exonuclease/phosphatase family metal-dependent hydrolase
MRVATFNVENLFRRASALNQDTWKSSESILNDWQRFNQLIEEKSYTDKAKQELAGFLTKYDLYQRMTKTAKFFLLHEVRGKLFKVPRGSKEPQIVADGRASWDGWLELKRDHISSDAIDNTARVIKAVEADVLAVVEAEDRIALQLFNDQILSRHGASYIHNMLIDGNDDRGIDVGVYSQLPIMSIRSNIDAGLPDGRIFSRDCAEFEISLPGGDSLWLMVNHFKSKGYGDKGSSDKRREGQAREVAQIYRKRHADQRFVIVAGDLNDTPDRRPLAPLIGETDLRDVMTHPKYTSKPTARPGTFGSGSKSNKLDYILLSPQLWDRILDADVERRGVWAPKTFPHFDTVLGPMDAASDHAAVWVDLDLG